MYKESEKLELKASFGEWKEIIKTLAGFANAKGGTVIVGLDDVGQPLGVEVGKGTIEDFANKVKANTDPVLYPSINVQTFGLGEIVEITVAPSDNKPVFAFERAYTRVGKSTQKLSTTEVRALITKYTLPDVDEQSIDQSVELSNLDDALIKKLPKYTQRTMTQAAYWCFVKKNTLFPNTLPKSIDIDNLYKNNRSVPRNKLLMEIFHKSGLIENWGTGFYRMRQWCRENGNPDPLFEHRGGALVTVFFPRENVPENVPEKRRARIIMQMKQDKNVTIAELARMLDANEKTIKRDITSLKDAGAIVRMGPDKGGYWQVVNINK